jgi:hypothetical protein
MPHVVSVYYTSGPRYYHFQFPNRELAVAFVGGHMGAEMSNNIRSEVVDDEDGSIVLYVHRF